MLLCILFVLGTHTTKTKLIFLSNLRDDLQEILKRSHEVNLVHSYFVVGNKETNKTTPG